MNRLDRDIEEAVAYWHGVRDTWPDSEADDAGRSIKVASRYIETLLKSAMSVHQASRSLAEITKVISERIDFLEEKVERLSN
jgi:hypothetical protein